MVATNFCVQFKTCSFQTGHTLNPELMMEKNVGNWYSCIEIRKYVCIKYTWHANMW